MVGSVSAKREPVPLTAIDVARAKRQSGARRVAVPVGIAPVEVVEKANTRLRTKSGARSIVIRKIGRGGPTETSGRARALKACKGKKGCEFAECVKDALGKVPPSLKVACPSV